MTRNCPGFCSTDARRDDTKSMRESVQICRGFSVEQWRGLCSRLCEDEPDAWSCAVEVFERRINERFFSCLESLVHADPKLDVPTWEADPADCSNLPDDGEQLVMVPGFAIMALCCLLIETLQSFREGGDRKKIEKFLRRPSFKGEFEDNGVAASFVKGVRNGILHDAETRGWVIWRQHPSGRIVEQVDGRFILYRTEFYRALKAEFDQYLSDLRDPENQRLRQRFVQKMNEIATRS